MKQNILFSFDNIITLLMPSLLMAMTVTHNVFFLYAIFALGILRINKPLVIFPVYFVASLSTGWFEISDGVSAGRYLSIMMIFSLLIDLIKRGKSFISTRLLSLLLVFIVYCLLSSMLSISGDMRPFYMILQSLIILFLFIVRKNDDMSILFDLLFFTSIIVIIGISVRTFSEGVSAFSEGRYGSDSAEGVNANRIAMMLAQIGALFSTIVFRNGTSIKWLISIVGILLSAYIIVLTGSRAGLIAIIVPFILMSFISNKDNLKKYPIPLVFLSIIVYFFMDWMARQDVAGLSRMSVQDVVDSGGNNRLHAIQVMMYNVFPNYLFFGVGLGGANFAIAAKEFGVSHPCHNIFFDSLAQLGIVGFILFFMLFFIVLKKTYCSIKRNSNNSICLIGFSLILAATANGIGETVYLEKLFWNAITICMIGNSIVASKTMTNTYGKI